MMRMLSAAAVLTVTTAMHDPGPELTVTPNVPVTHLRSAVGPDGRVAAFTAETSTAAPEAIARAALEKAVGSSEHWNVMSSYATKHTGTRHVTLQQEVSGLACANCIATCNIAKDGRVINLAYTAHVGAHPHTAPTISAHTALETVVALYNMTVPANATRSEENSTDTVHLYPAAAGLSPHDVKISLDVIATAAHTAELTWHVEIETDAPAFHIYEAWVTASRHPEVVRLYDIVNWDNWGVPEDQQRAATLRGNAHSHVKRKAPVMAKTSENEILAKRIGGTYDVYTVPFLDPTLGEREVRAADVDERASPLGWHDQGEASGGRFSVTVGNNVCAHDNPNNNPARSCEITEAQTRPDGGPELDFVYEFDQTTDPTLQPTLNAAITNLFYWHNIVHDIFYLNGFDEPAGNFQENNFGLGGLQDDSIQANAQDGAGLNNANFATPVDGQRPRCRMYLWNGFEPFIDGDFDSGIIVHEIGHGISNRLTGGPNQSGCLPGGQSGGMGEGWSDWWAIALMQQVQFVPEQPFPMGDYVRPGGIRIYPYSFDFDVNPTTFDYLSDSRYTGVHAIGSVWCNMLMDVFWAMRAEYDFDPDWYDGVFGNNILWQNVLDGLKLQPCGPTFVDARDAILLADEINYGGEHVCVMWCAFARRGLGLSATTTGPSDRAPVEAFDVPVECSCEFIKRIEDSFATKNATTISK